ncbi:methylated-DNA--protein-cysteine methyltransferase isoform X4 [Sus scrofa]|uniref:methylated-DNA--protein-cysteine methyltransferase isoform X4 n=1 Tax=Sus scrofa TaxID=9823 RepID=UPI000A2B8478|nr:methylated-DNA--protein-cysteine methyltransferase isoform X4 [Sus scrofa]
MAWPVDVSPQKQRPALAAQCAILRFHPDCPGVSCCPPTPRRGWWGWRACCLVAGSPALLTPSFDRVRPAEAPAPPKQLAGPEEMMEPLGQCAAWLDAYFRKPAVLQELPVPALHHPLFQQESFTRQVLWKLLQAVKFGETVSYQQLAALVGSPRAARAVGGAMRSNPVPILVPCHRVVLSSGATGNYSGGMAVKEWLLAHEGRLAGKLACGGGSRPAGASRQALRGGSTRSQAAGQD